MEARGFRVAYPDIQRLNGEVVGVSPDSKETLQRYVAENNFPFGFASDSSKHIARAWGATRRITGGIKRVSFVVAPGGRIHSIIAHEVFIPKHISDALNALRSIAP
jgi:peroxiredoxin Q/BCP